MDEVRIQYISENLQTPIAADYDVIVVGGGASGTVAAIAAAKAGARTLLLERGGCLGGAATANLVAQWVAFYHGDTRVLGGIPYELTQRVQAKGGSKGFDRYTMGEAAGNPFPLRNFPINPEVVKIVLDEAVVEAGVTTLFHTVFSRSLVQDGVIQGVVVENVEGRRAYRAKVVIDASGDAAVCADAGVPCFGDGQNDESKRQPCTLSFRLSNVDVPRFKAVPREERIRLVKEGLDSGELFWKSISFVSTPGDSDAICLMSRINGIDALSATDVSFAEQEGRRQVASIVRYLNRAIPGFENAILADIAERVGVRETRRIQGLYLFKHEDIMEEVAFEDSIALGAGPMDTHEPGGTGIVLYAPPSPFEIPLRALIPVSIEGLLVCGRTLSADSEAMAGARHMGTSMAMGQAVGSLAAIAVQTNQKPSLVPAASVQEVLSRENALFKREHVGSPQA